jgi:adenylate kinase family enzyme
VIIGICGLIGSGKNTVAEHLMEEHTFTPVSFAETLKDAAASIFDWNRDMLEGATAEARAAREVKDEWWSERLGFDVTPRYMLQFMGTEVMREKLHQDIWALSLERKLSKELANTWMDFVISDVRFPNEVAMIRRLGGKIWHVRRGDLPTWFGTDPADVHESEKAWNNERFDHVLYNDHTIEDLKRAVDKLLEP